MSTMRFPADTVLRSVGLLNLSWIVLSLISGPRFLTTIRRICCVVNVKGIGNGIDGLTGVHLKT